MRIIIKHIWRNILSNSFRSILIIISLALASSVFYVNLNIKDDVMDSTKILLQGPYKDYDICIAGDVKSAILPDYEKKMEIESSDGIIDEKVAVVSGCNLESVLSEGLVTIDADADEYGLGEINVEGNAIMPRTKALYLGIQPEEKFTVTINGEDREYRLLCYADSLGLFSQGSSEIVEILVYEDDIEPNMELVALTDENDLDDVCEKISANSIDEQGNDDIDAYALYDVNGTSSRLESIKKILSIILLLVIVIAFYVISSTGNLIINYRIPVIGTFRSLGATELSTSILLVCENILYGLAASIPGMFFGELIRQKIRTVGLGTDAGEINWPYLLLIPVFAISINVVISLFAIIKTNKKPIKELVFRKQTTASKPSAKIGIVGIVMLALSFAVAYYNSKYNFVMLVVELALTLLGAGFSMGLICELVSKLFAAPVMKIFGGAAWMGLKNLGVSRINRSSSLLVTVVIALVLMVYICAGSVTNFFSVYENNYPYDIMIKRSVGAEEKQKYLEELDGVESVVYEYWDIGTPMVNGVQKKTCFCANDGFSNGIEADDGVLENLQDGEAVLDKMYAIVNDFEIGDEIVFNTGDEAGEREDFTLKVVGLCESGVFLSSRNTVVITRSDFFKYVEVDPAIIGISTSRDIGEMISDINDAIAKETGDVYAVYSKNDYVGSEVDEAQQAAKSVSAVPVLALILALFGLINNQIIAFNQKRIEYAVLYSTSMSRVQLGKMMISEIFTSFLTGCVMGILLSLWLSKIMRDILFVTIAYFPLVVTYSDFEMIALIFFALLIVTSYFPLRRLKRLSIISEIKYE